MSSGDHTGGVSGTRQRILVTGANGQVGWELLRALRGLGEIVPAARGPEVLTAAGRSLALDLSDPDGLRQLVRSVQPTLIVNAAAHTAVDKAETEPELATAINAIAPGVLAEEAKRIGAAMIHFSTDYVFDGSGTTARTESDPTGPLGVYGRSKLAGELAIEASDVPHAILRTSWVYGVHGHNFVKTMLRLGSEREQLSVVADQIGAPTSARVIAEATAALIASCQGHVQETLTAKGGVFHFCCSGETSWYEFAVSIFEAARRVGHPLKVRSVRAIASHEYPTPAQRPRNSRLDCGRVARTFGVQLPHWQAAFEDIFPALFQQWHASTRSVGAPHILTFPAGKRVVNQP